MLLGEEGEETEKYPGYKIPGETIRVQYLVSIVVLPAVVLLPHTTLLLYS